MDWIVTMWHFGTDSKVEYEGERFRCSWELANNIVVSLYSKDWKIGVRKEKNDIVNGRQSIQKRRIRLEARIS
jgi:hypothetical protein